MFTGRELDKETGLYYYRARYYNPGIGRFLQTDPIGYFDSMNLYQYCNNNPVRWRDPWGLCGNKSWGEKVKGWWKDVSVTPGKLREAERTAQKYLSRPGHNDIRDAMRHAEWSKEVTEKSGSGTTAVAGVGHEIDNMINDDQSLDELRMDLNNNREGRKAAKEGRPINPNNLTTIIPPSNNGPY